MNGECGLCGAGYVNAWHNFVVCPFAKGCWRLMGVESLIDHGVTQFDSISELLFFILNQQDNELSYGGVAVMERKKWFGVERGL